MEATPEINSFLRSTLPSPMTISTATLARAMNVEELQNICAELHPMVQN